MPPFFGIQNLEKNRTFTNAPGQVCSSHGKFLDSLEAEVVSKHKNGQPVLIFADSKRQHSTEIILVQDHEKCEEMEDGKLYVRIVADAALTHQAT